MQGGANPSPIWLNSCMSTRPAYTNVGPKSSRPAWPRFFISFPFKFCNSFAQLKIKSSFDLWINFELLQNWIFLIQMGCYRSKLNQILNSNIQFYYSTITYPHVYKSESSFSLLYTTNTQSTWKKKFSSSDVLFWSRFCIVTVCQNYLCVLDE